MEADHLRFIFMFPLPIPDPPPDGKSDADELPRNDDDDLFDFRLSAFRELGFDDLTALALAWNRVSPSEVRTRWASADREVVARYFLGEDE